MSLTFLYTHTHTFTGSEQWVQAHVRGEVVVMEIRQRRAIHHLSQTPPMRIQPCFPTLCWTELLVECQTYFKWKDSLLASVWPAEVWQTVKVSWRYWCDFVLVLFRWPPGRSSSALSVLPLMDWAWIRHTWWRGMTLCLGNPFLLFLSVTQAFLHVGIHLHITLARYRRSWGIFV